MKKFPFLCCAAFSLILLCGAARANAIDALPWHKISFNGSDVAYLDTGKKDAPALIFIHGWSCDTSFWRLQVPEFAKDYRVISVDLPGFGKSALPPRVLQEAPFTMEYFARAVHAVATDAAVDKPVLIGHSMGYAIARQYLITYPDTVRAVVNVDGAYFRIPETPETLASFEAGTSGVLASLEGPERQEAVRAFVESTFYGKTPEPLRTEIMAAMSSANPHAADSTLREMFRLEQWKERSFDVPCLALYAADQPMLEGNREHLHTVFPNLIYEEWKNNGHYLMLEDPDRFNAALHAFLKTL